MVDSHFSSFQRVVISREGRYFPRVIHEVNAILTGLVELRLSSKWTNRELISREREKERERFFSFPQRTFLQRAVPQAKIFARLERQRSLMGVLPNESIIEKLLPRGKT